MKLFRNSKFLLAALAFAAINVALAASIKQLPFMARKADEKGIVFQAANSAVEQFEQKPVPPHVVLMGSSVMMAPLWSCDSLKFPNVADVYHHHESQTLGALLQQRGEGGDCFAFALPGAMVSDIYLITDKLLRGPRVPKLIVYGLAPRDFMDDLLTGETRTAVFQRLSDLTDLAGNADLYLSSWNEKADFALNNSVFMYGKRCRYQDKLTTFSNKLLTRLSRSQEPAIKQEAGFAFASGGMQDRAAMWSKSVEEYRARYKHFNEKQFDKQCDFLTAFLKTARDRNIDVLLVNMPLSSDNLQLMPAGFYDRYKQSVSQLSRQYGASYLDLQPQNYDDLCFYDTVHLNAQGGERLLASIAEWIAKNAHGQLASGGAAH